MRTNNTPARARPFFFGALLVAALVGIDRWTKLWAESRLSEGNIGIFSDVLRLRLVHNEGVAFSFPITGTALKILTVALLAYVAYYFFRVEPRRSETGIASLYAAFFAGGLGNAYDRLFIGKVTDFIDVKYFAVFNFADIMVTCSAAAIVLLHFLHERRKRPLR